MKLYEHDSSGNCLKVRLLLRQLELPYESVSVDLFRGETRTPEHFARNPDGRIPVLETDDGDLIPESGAILLFLAEGTPFLPAPACAGARAPVDVLRAEPDRGRPGGGALPQARGPRRDDARGVRQPPRARPRRAGHARPRAGRRRARSWPATTTRWPTSRSTATGTAAPTRAPTRASIANVAAWLDRVEATPGFVNDLAPVPAHVSERPI